MTCYDHMSETQNHIPWLSDLITDRTDKSDTIADAGLVRITNHAICTTCEALPVTIMQVICFGAFLFNRRSDICKGLDPQSDSVIQPGLIQSVTVGVDQCTCISYRNSITVDQIRASCTTESDSGPLGPLSTIRLSHMSR